MALFGVFCACMANFLPFSPPTSHARRTSLPHKPNTSTDLKETTPQHQHTKPRNETFSAPAPHTNPRGETFIAPAPQKRPKITHFHHAGANFLSQHPPPTQHTPTPGRLFFHNTQSKPSPANSRMQFHTRPPHSKESRGNCMRNWGSPEAMCARPGRGAGGRRRGLATQHTDTPTDWRPPRGLRGLAGLRGAAPNEVRPPSLAGGRALRHPEHQRHHTQQQQEDRREACGV